MQGGRLRKMTFGCAVLTVLTLGASEGFPLTMEADIWASLTNRFFDARTEMLYDVMWKVPDGGE